MTGPSAVVLLSGGLDSATVLAEALAQGRTVHALSFHYGQRHVHELRCARYQAQIQGVHEHLEIGLESLGELVRPATALVRGSPVAVSKSGESNGKIPSTYVPARNTVFLAYALAWAEVLEAGEIWLGVNAVDYSGYPDCRPQYVEAFEHLANLATRRGVEDPGALRVVAPLLHLGKHEIIALGLRRRVDYAMTVSCYDPAEREGAIIACGRCDSCRLRREGFARAQATDPARYADASGPWP